MNQIKIYKAFATANAFLFTRKKWLACLCLVGMVGLCFSQTNYCIQDRFSQEAYFDTSEVAIEWNVTYGNAVNKFLNQPQDLKMDIFYPKTGLDPLAKKPLIYFIHGGGFLGGDKNEGTYKCTEWAKRGYVAVSINYRTGWACANGTAALLCWCTDGQGFKHAVYEAVQDARAGLRFISANAATYGIDTTSVFMAGESAGSITAMLSTYWTQAQADSFNKIGYQNLGSLDSSGNAVYSAWQVRGVINSCGAVTDTAIINGANALPTIGFHDDNDCVVPYKRGFFINCTGSCYYFTAGMGSSLVNERLNNLGVCSKLYEVVNSNQHCSFPQNQLVQKSACFVKGIMCNDCQPGFSTNAYDSVGCNAGIVATGINNISKEVAHVVYPNPTDGDVTLVFTLSEPQQVTLTLIDVLGRQVENSNAYYNAGKQEIKINGDQLAAGINFYVLRTKQGVVKGKIIRH